MLLLKEAIIQAYTDSKVSISNSCFIQQDPLSKAFVSVGFIGSVGSIGGNFGDIAIANEACNGIFTEIEDLCVLFDAQICRLFHMNEGCYSNWNGLSKALHLSSVSCNGGTYTICPGTVMILPEYLEHTAAPLSILASNTVVKCGENGKLENACIIFGGEKQIEILGSPTNVRIIGLTFMASTVTSILASGASDAKVTFENCKFAVRKQPIETCKLDIVTKIQDAFYLQFYSIVYIFHGTGSHWNYNSSDIQYWCWNG